MPLKIMPPPTKKNLKKNNISFICFYLDNKNCFKTSKNIRRLEFISKKKLPTLIFMD